MSPTRRGFCDRKPVFVSAPKGPTAVAIALIVIVGGLGIGSAVGTPGKASSSNPAPPAAPTHAAVAPGASTTPTVAQRLREIESTLHARGVPAQDIHPPDLAAEDPGAHGPVAPTYSTGPAPMGIADLGLRNESGTLRPYDLNTSRVWGSVDFTRAASVYVDGDGPDTFGIQLNAVATNITLFGEPGFQFWTQNFASYTPSTEQLSLGDNVWNFSAEPFSANAIYAHGQNGSPEPPIYYYAVGPTLTVAYPFTLNLYLNAALVGGRPAVFFNYSVVETHTTLRGSFDYVVFASTLGPVAHAAQVPAFEVNGTGLDPIGLPNDFELVLVGNDDGDTTTFFAMNATMALEYWNATLKRFAVVPTAYDAGSDTGETSNGILPVYQVPLLGGPPTVDVRMGPSFVQGLWNVSQALDGSRQFTDALKPQNAFLFVSPGSTFDAATAQWVPTLRLGAASSDFSVPNGGAYSFRWMLSDRVPLNYSVTTLLPLPNTTTALSENLTVSVAEGSYTPLLAFGNAQVRAISEHGDGLLADPYVLVHHPVGALNPVFGQLNDFGFPVFAGVLLVNTTAYVRVTETPVTIDYGTWEYAPGAPLAILGLPHTNALQLEFWNVSHLQVVNSSGITGWLSLSFAFYPAGEILFWGSSDNLVANDTFYDQGAAIALFGGTNNTVWGNRFLDGAVSPRFYEGNNTTGVLESESGDLLYNNYFADTQPAVTPTVNAASCQIVCLNATYDDRWNVTPAPAATVRSVLDQNLSGSILHTAEQGGNYWWNYGSPSDPFGVLPYDNAGLITVGGDYAPLTPSMVYNVTFVASGLAHVEPWNVTFLGRTTLATTASLTLFAPNGTFNYTVAAPHGYAGDVNGTVVVNGTAAVVNVTFTELFGVSLLESGLVTGWSWSVTLANATGVGTNRTLLSTSTDATGLLANATYTVTASAYGYALVSAPTPLDVDGTFSFVDLAFTLLPVLAVSASGLPDNAPWTVTVVQGASNLNLTGIGSVTVVFTVLELDPGSYSWSAFALGYLASPSTGSASAPRSTLVHVAFHKVAGASSSSGLSTDAWWAAVGALAALAVVGFTLFAVERRRRPRPPPPIVAAPALSPPAASAAAAATPSGPAPWEEGPADAERSEPFVRKP